MMPVNFNILGIETENIRIRWGTDRRMLVNAVLCGFFAVDEQTQQGIVLDHLGDDLLYFLSYDADLNAASDNIGINNAIL